METDKIKKKIRALLKLSQSPNEGESLAAIKAAHRLLLKHNVKQSEIGEELQHVSKVIHSYKGIRMTNKEFSYVSDIITHHFKVVITYSFLKKQKKINISMYGTESAIEIAENVFFFLTQEFKRRFDDKKKEHKNIYGSSLNRGDFYKGMLISLHNKLERSKREAQQEWGLVIIEDVELKKYEERCKTARGKKPRESKMEDVELGLIEGKSIEINAALKNSETAKEQLA